MSGYESLPSIAQASLSSMTRAPWSSVENDNGSVSIIDSNGDTVADAVDPGSAKLLSLAPEFAKCVASSHIEYIIEIIIDEEGHSVMHRVVRDNDNELDDLLESYGGLSYIVHRRLVVDLPLYSVDV